MTVARQSLLIVAVTAAAYARTLGHDFVYDDVSGILSNPLVSGFNSLSQTWNVLAQPWRSLTTLTYAWTFHLVGFNSTIFHLTNVVLHAINSLLVFGIARSLARRWLSPEHVSAFALIAGLFHATHPIYTEAVAYVWGRSSLLCGAFYFGAVLLMLSTFERNGKQRILLCAAALLAGILAWKSKEEAITLPGLAVVYLALTRNWRAIAPVLAAPVLVVITKYKEIEQVYVEVGRNERLVSIGLGSSLPPIQYFLTHVKASVLYYIQRFIFPAQLNADPDIAPVSSPFDPAFLFAAAVLAALAVWSVVSWRKYPLLSFGVLALLVSPLTAYAVMPLSDVAAEHRVYIAGLGFDLVAAWFIVRLGAYRRFAMAATTLLLAILTIQRSEVWANSLTLWKDAERKSPMRIRPHLNLGEAYQNAGNIEAALEEYRHANALNSRLTPVYVNMGAIYLSRNELDPAEAALNRAKELSPQIGEIYVNLALIAVRRNHAPEAYELIERAASLDPQSFLVHFTRGDVLVLMSRFDEAIGEYETAVRLRPDLAVLKQEVDSRLARLRESRLS